MGINDDEQPRILVELTLVDPNPASPVQVPEQKPQITQAIPQQPEASPKKEKRVKSYMNPIHNLKNKGGVAPQETVPTPTKQPVAKPAN